MPVTFEGVDQDLADSVTGWSAGSLDTDSEFQGTGCVGAKTSGTAPYLHSGTARNFGVGGAEENDHVYVAYNFLTPTLETLANGGIRATAGTAGATWGYSVDGSDTYSGGWKVACFDPTATADIGTSAETGVQRFGITYTTTGGIMGNFNNGLVDAVRIGQGLRITGGTAVTPSVFNDFSDADFGTKANRWGVVSTLGGVLYVQGKLFFGAATGEIFEDDNKVVVFVDAPVSSTHHELVVDDPTTFNSCLFLTEGAVRPAISGSGGLTSNNTFYQGFRASSLPPSAIMTGDTFSGCEAITQNGAQINNTSVVDGLGDGIILDDLSNIDGLSVDNCAGYGVDLTALTATEITLNNISISNFGAGAGVVNNSSDVVINQGVGSNIGTTSDWINTGAGNVSVVAGLRSFNFTVSPPIIGYEWRIYSVPTSGSLSGSVELAGEESAIASDQSYSYTYSTPAVIAVQIMEAGDYEESVTYYTLVDADQSVGINLSVENNQ